MMTPAEYVELSVYYSRMAETVRDSYSRYQLQMLADSYMTLAHSTQVLDRSSKVLDGLGQHRKK